MKKLLFAVSALAALSLLAPSTGLAQYNNQLGIFADVAGTTAQIDGATPYSTNTAYVVVINPYNTTTNAPIAGIRAVEFGIVTTNLTVLGLTFPQQNVNVGTNTNVICGFGTPITVSGGMAVVGTYSFLYAATDGSEALVTMTPTTPVSIPGFMALQDASNELLYPLSPASGDWAAPVFGINPVANIVATTPSTMDSVKALYR